ncbi:MAG: hypothetical protein ACTSVI_07265 [Promethearchaeota archaeon]
MDSNIKELIKKSYMKYDYIWNLSIVYGISLLLTFIPLWQIVVIGGFVGGLLVKKKAGIAWWTGFIGVALAWFTVIVMFCITQKALMMMDLIIEFLIGAGNLGVIGMVLSILIGGLIGGVGGFLGFSIRKGIFEKEK